LAGNNFTGNLKPEIGIALPNLQVIWWGVNEFTGSFPASLANASELQDVDISENYFTGNIPMSFGRLQNFLWLNAHRNLLGNHSVDDLIFLTSLTNCSQLRWLAVGYNLLGGELPNSITNLSAQLTWLQLGENLIGGIIPMQISNLASLTELDLEENLLTGNIPASIGKLSNLNRLYLGGNKFTGEIPLSVGNMTRLLELSLYNNSLEGSIPSSLARCRFLLDVRFFHNKLNGTIPEQLLGLPALSIVLNVSHNSLTCPLPPEVGNLQTLVAMDFSYNNLSEEIPRQLKDCLALEVLYMQGNFFEGTIPDMSGLKGIQYLDLSHNNLTGTIPSYMVSFPSLQNLNLSFNNLKGEVPEQGVFRNATAIQVYGNRGLCGGIQELQLPTCPTQGSKKHRKHVAFKLILALGIAAAFCLTLLSLVYLCCLRKSKKKSISVSSFGQFYQRISYQELPIQPVDSLRGI
jgi:LRR receptor-like serine/threonine-protein kinase EFR